MSAEGSLSVFQIICWLIALLVLSIHSYVLVMFPLIQAAKYACHYAFS
jgi:hypothetical protein